MSDYPQVITPGARCEKCDHHKSITQTAIGIIVRCGLYGQYYDNDQAEHCINYYVPKKWRTSDKNDVEAAR